MVQAMGDSEKSTKFSDLQIELPSKAYPPFTNLQSFIVTGTILSYYSERRDLRSMKCFRKILQNLLHFMYALGSVGFLISV